MKLGITGGIGSGKSTVCKIFSVLGIPVFSADSVASEIIEGDLTIVRGLNSLAGRNLYENGGLDRKGLAKLIFNDPELLKKVNSLVHPLVFDSFRKWVKVQSAPYVIMEAAILFESGASKLMDKCVTVVASIEERILRVSKRNNVTRNEVIERMNNQMDDESKMRLSDFVIYNSENDMIIPTILTIHSKILKEINSTF